MTLLFSPFEWIIFLFPAISGLFFLLRLAESRRQAFFTGWWFGMGMYVSGLYWISNSLLVDADRFAWMIPFAVIGLNGVLAIYSGLLGLVIYYVRSAPLIWQWVSFAVAWGALEALRSVLFTGFPWNLIGYGLVFSETMMQIVYHVPLLYVGVIMVAIGTVPVLCVEQRRLGLTAAVGAVIVSASIYSYGTKVISVDEAVAQKAAEPGHVQTVYSLIQGNIPQTLKSDPAHRQKTLETYIRLTEEAREKVSPGQPHVIIWPETAFPFIVDGSGQWTSLLSNMLKPNEALITGAVRMANEKDGVTYYNSLFVIEQGQPPRVYDKRHLVPFGEYVPFRSILPIEKITPGLSDFSKGRNVSRIPAHDRSVVGAFVPLICYEVIFAGYADPNSETLETEMPTAMMVNLTNDGWFGDSIGPYQHLMMSRFRAIEQKLPLLRVANSGITAFIDLYGRVVGEIELFQQGIMARSH